ncbi:MAG: hypothetical protein EOP86_26750 [Verrucomicrobiaceae bacterium]|nr:MAG: hypothetical protein EOP86_26750 [Verrucomicrobiaceae bacterium]
MNKPANRKRWMHGIIRIFFLAGNLLAGTGHAAFTVPTPASLSPAAATTTTKTNNATATATATATVPHDSLTGGSWTFYRIGDDGTPVRLS